MRPEKTLKFRPKSVTAEDDFTYRVSFQQDDGEASYLFTVDKDFPTVGWAHEFWLAMGVNINPATSLFRCILELHKARQYGVRVKNSCI